ncbi:hypothetical protein D3C85_714410 [compost metagenome]
MQGVEQVGAGDGLDQYGIHLCRRGGLHERAVIVRTDHDDRGEGSPRELRPNRLQRAQAVHFGHLPIGDDHIEEFAALGQCTYPLQRILA